MTSLRQIEANRRNASKSTGPSTEAGKDRSRRNALRHGLTAETVIASFEDAEEYKRFEVAVTADFNPETAVERELVLRLASLLWRLRRAASIETGLFQVSTEIVADGERTAEPASERLAGAGAHPETPISSAASDPNVNQQTPLAHWSKPERIGAVLQGDTDVLSSLARRFLHLADVDKGAFDRLGRYETALWRQVCQTVFMLELLRRQGLDMKWLPRSSHRGSSNIFSLPGFLRR